MNTNLGFEYFKYCYFIDEYFKIHHISIQIMMFWFKNLDSSWAIQTAICRGNIELKLSAGSPYNYRCRQKPFSFVPTKYYFKENDVGENKIFNLTINIKMLRINKFKLKVFLWMDVSFLSKKSMHVATAFQTCNKITVGYRL